MGDAAALEMALADVRLTRAEPGGVGADMAVLRAAESVGVLVTNDLALGRRPRDLGIVWLRTEDLLTWQTEVGTLSRPESGAAIVAPRDSGRITADLAQAYREEIS